MGYFVGLQEQIEVDVTLLVQDVVADLMAKEG